MARKGENIRQRKDGRWEARYIRDYDDNGKAVFGYVYGADYAEAKAKKLCAVNGLFTCDMQNGDCAAGITVIAAVREWFLYENMNIRVKVTTCDKYDGMIRRYIEPYFRDMSIGGLSTSAVSAFSAFLLEKGGKNGKPLSAKTVTDVLILLKQVVKYLNEHDYNLPRAIKFRLPRQKPKKMQIFTASELHKLVKSLAPQEERIDMGITLGIMTGLRLGELCGLKWSDIDFTCNTVTVSRSVSRIKNTKGGHGAKTVLSVDTPKTECSERVIPLPEASMKFLYKRRQATDDFIITGSAQCPDPRNVYNRYKKILKSCGLPDYTFHALRHTFATKCVEVGFDPKSLSEILGHADVTITMRRYVHPTLDMKRIQMERLFATAKK